MGSVDVSDPRTQDDWPPGEGWAPGEDREEYVDLAALERAHAHQVVVDGLGSAAWTVAPPVGGRDDGTGAGDDGGTNSEGDDYDPDADPDADPDTLDPERHNRPETD